MFLCYISVRSFEARVTRRQEGERRVQNRGKWGYMDLYNGVYVLLPWGWMYHSLLSGGNVPRTEMKGVTPRGGLLNPGKTGGTSTMMITTHSRTTITARPSTHPVTAAIPHEHICDDSTTRAPSPVHRQNNNSQHPHTTAFSTFDQRNFQFQIFSRGPSAENIKRAHYILGNVIVVVRLVFV